MAKKPSIDEREHYAEVFNKYFAEFKANKYDPAFLVDIQKRLIPYATKLNKELNPVRPGAPYVHYVTRMFYEYAITRIPKEDVILRELIMERIRDSWEQQRILKRNEANQELLRKFERTLNNAVSRALERTLYELIAHQVIPENRIDSLDDVAAMSLKDDRDRDYEFGYVRDNVLTWTGFLTQLSIAIHRIQSKLGYDSLTPYYVVQHVEESGKIKLSKGKFSTLTKYLEQLQSKKAGFQPAKFIDEASKVVRHVLQSE